MQELRFVAVSEDGQLRLSSRSRGGAGRYILPIDERLAGGPLKARPPGLAPVRDRSGESVASQGDPGTNPRPARRRERNR